MIIKEWKFIKTKEKGVISVYNPAQNCNFIIRFVSRAR